MTPKAAPKQVMKSNANSEGEVDNFVYVFTMAYDPLTNWSAHQITIWGERFATVEHAFQYKKFIEHDPKWAKTIQLAVSPREAKRLSHTKKIPRHRWDTERLEVMKALLQAKVDQHNDVLQALLATGDRAIIVDGPDTDVFWGIGADGKGQNALGKLWMVLRKKCLDEANRTN
jgi:ribA/ribD-fused uncharacterized protein